MSGSDGGSPIRSMTGFGRGSAERSGIRADVDLKGLNQRFLDIKMKLPPEVGRMEPELRALIQGRVSRARVDVLVSLLSLRPAPSRVVLDRDRIAQYLDAAESLKKEFGLKGTVGLESVLALPGAFTVQAEAGPADGATEALVREALLEALQAYDAMRASEGRRLIEDVRARLAAIGAAAGRIASASADLSPAYARKIRERLARLLEGAPAIDEGRLAQEVALLAGRVDITEEIVRLRGYLAQCADTLDRARGPVGKTLDFIMQEMNRETNTISSKAEELPICQDALLIRAEVERIREQVQNLE